MTVAAISISCPGSTPSPASADLKVGTTKDNGAASDVAAADVVPTFRSADTDRQYLLDRVDEAAVVQLYADGFEALPVDQRTLILEQFRMAR
jgi:hypothetical protein